MLAVRLKKTDRKISVKIEQAQGWLSSYSTRNNTPPVTVSIMLLMWCVYMDYLSESFCLLAPTLTFENQWLYEGGLGSRVPLHTWQYQI